MEAYDVIRPLASGSFGQIFLVRDKQKDELSVLKKISVATLDEKERDSVEQEVALLATLYHPNIVAYKGNFLLEREQQLCILMEFCDSGDLYTYLQKTRKSQPMGMGAGAGGVDHVHAGSAAGGGPLGAAAEESMLIDWLIQIVSAVQFLHARSILHRDLKTQNIFLHSAGQSATLGSGGGGERESNPAASSSATPAHHQPPHAHPSRIIKLGDFGIAKVLDSSNDNLARTQIGTPFYMSPEVFKNASYSYKSDIWGIGCVLYELVCGKHAFGAQSLNGLAVKVLKGKYTPLPNGVKCSKELQTLIKSLLSVNPQFRPSISEMLHLPIIRRKIKNTVKTVTTGLAKSAEERVLLQSMYVDQFASLGLGALFATMMNNHYDGGGGGGGAGPGAGAGGGPPRKQQMIDHVARNAGKMDANSHANREEQERMRKKVQDQVEKDMSNLKSKLDRLRAERARQEEQLRSLEETKRTLLSFREEGLDPGAEGSDLDDDTGSDFDSDDDLDSEDTTTVAVPIPPRPNANLQQLPPPQFRSQQEKVLWEKQIGIENARIRYENEAKYIQAANAYGAEMARRRAQSDKWGHSTPLVPAAGGNSLDPASADYNPYLQVEAHNMQQPGPGSPPAAHGGAISSLHQHDGPEGAGPFSPVHMLQQNPQHQPRPANIPSIQLAAQHGAAPHPLAPASSRMDGQRGPPLPSTSSQLITPRVSQTFSRGPEQRHWWQQMDISTPQHQTNLGRVAAAGAGSPDQRPVAYNPRSSWDDAAEGGGMLAAAGGSDHGNANADGGGVAASSSSAAPGDHAQGRGESEYNQNLQEPHSVANMMIINSNSTLNSVGTPATVVNLRPTSEEQSLVGTFAHISDENLRNPFSSCRPKVMNTPPLSPVFSDEGTPAGADTLFGRADEVSVSAAAGAARGSELISAVGIKPNAVVTSSSSAGGTATGSSSSTAELRQSQGAGAQRSSDAQGYPPNHADVDTAVHTKDRQQRVAQQPFVNPSTRHQELPPHPGTAPGTAASRTKSAKRRRQEMASIHAQIEACMSAITKSQMTIDSLQFRLQDIGSKGDEGLTPTHAAAAYYAGSSSSAATATAAPTLGPGGGLRPALYGAGGAGGPPQYTQAQAINSNVSQHPPSYPYSQSQHQQLQPTPQQQNQIQMSAAQQHQRVPSSPALAQQQYEQKEMLKQLPRGRGLPAHQQPQPQAHAQHQQFVPSTSNSRSGGAGGGGRSPAGRGVSPPARGGMHTQEQQAQEHDGSPPPQHLPPLAPGCAGRGESVVGPRGRGGDDHQQSTSPHRAAPTLVSKSQTRPQKAVVIRNKHPFQV